MPSGEAKQLAGERGATLDGCFYPFDRLDTLGITNPRFEHAGLSNEDRQQIVEIMSDAAGEMSKRFHFLRVRKLLLRAHQSQLGFASFGDVACYLGEANQTALFVFDGVEDDVRPER